MANTYAGIVQDFQMRQETKGWKVITIWSFRLVQTDRNGYPLLLIPVEIREEKLKGSISDGDVVEVKGKWKEGQILKTSKIYNKTLGIEAGKK